MAYWMAWNGFVQLPYALAIFSCCTLMRPHTKLQIFARFWPTNCYNRLSTPYFQYLSPPDDFLFPNLKIKLKSSKFSNVAEILEAVTDELYKFQKQEITAAFQKLYDRAKSICIYISQWSLFWIETYICVFLMCTWGNNTKDKSVVRCDVCGCLIKYIWRVLMYNNVGIIDYVSVVLTCLHAGLFVRKTFSALAFVFIISSLYEKMAR